MSPGSLIPSDDEIAKELIAVAVADRDGQLGEIRLQVQRTAEALS